MMVRRRDVEVARLNLGPVFSMDYGQRPRLAADGGNELAKKGGMCRTTTTAAGKSARSPATTSFNASAPPAEAPMTILR
jgi:hypothetical protein